MGEMVVMKKSKFWKRNLPQCHFFYYKVHMTGQGFNPAVHAVRSAHNCMSHGIAPDL
jgi:hypothetical protein